MGNWMKSQRVIQLCNLSDLFAESPEFLSSKTCSFPKYVWNVPDTIDLYNHFSKPTSHLTVVFIHAKRFDSGITHSIEWIIYNAQNNSPPQINKFPCVLDPWVKRLWELLEFHHQISYFVSSLLRCSLLTLQALTNGLIGFVNINKVFNDHLYDSENDVMDMWALYTFLAIIFLTSGSSISRVRFCLFSIF